MKKSYMKPDELKSAITTLFGSRGSAAYAKLIGKSNVTVSRQLHGKSAISETQAILTVLLLQQGEKALDKLL